MRLHSERAELVSNMEELSTELMRWGMNEPQLVDAIRGMGACVENCTGSLKTLVRSGRGERGSGRRKWEEGGGGRGVGGRGRRGWEGEWKEEVGRRGVGGGGWGGRGEGVGEEVGGRGKEGGGRKGVVGGEEKGSGGWGR